jgi:hypothetical protein
MAVSSSIPKVPSGRGQAGGGAGVHSIHQSDSGAMANDSETEVTGSKKGFGAPPHQGSSSTEDSGRQIVSATLSLGTLMGKVRLRDAQGH